MSDIQDVLLNHFSDEKLWGSKFFDRINHLGAEANLRMKQGDLEFAEKCRMDEIVLYEFLLYQGRALLDDVMSVITLITCGEAYSSLSNIYYKTDRDDTLPLLLSYVRLVSGITRGMNIELRDANISTLYERGITSLEHVTHLLTKKECEIDSLIGELNSFPTLESNEHAIFYYENVLYNISKEDIDNTRKMLKEIENKSI
jgi:hypothetical protein